MTCFFLRETGICRKTNELDGNICIPVIYKYTAQRS